MTRLEHIPKTGIPETPKGTIRVTGCMGIQGGWVLGTNKEVCDTHYCFILPPDGEAEMRHEFETKLAMHATLSTSNFELDAGGVYTDSAVENLYQAFKLGRA